MRAAMNNGLIKAVAFWALIISVSLADAQTDFALGNKAFNRGDYKTAIEYYTRAIEQNSRFGDAYFNRALAHYRSRFSKPIPKQALEDINKSIALIPDKLAAYRLSAKINAAIGASAEGDATKMCELGDCSLLTQMLETARPVKEANKTEE